MTQILCTVRTRLLADVMTLCVFAITTQTAYGQSLEEAVSTALLQYPKLNQSIHRVQARQHEETVARSGYFPTLNLQGAIGHERSNSPTTRAGGPASEEHLQRSESSIVLRQVIFEGFITVHDDRRTKAATLSEQYQLLNVASETTLEVTRSYLTYIMRENVLALARRNLDAHEEIYYNIFKRSESGVQSIADLSQIKGRLARAQSNVIATENNLKDARIHFLKLVGQLPENLSEPLSDKKFLPISVEQALDRSKNNYPLLLSSRFANEAAENEYNGSKGSYFPELSIEAAQSWNHNLNGVKGRDDDFTIMFHARYNLLNGGRDSGRRQASMSRWQESVDIYHHVLLETEEEVRLSWEARNQLDKQLPKLREHLEASKDTVKGYRRQFILEDRTLLDVLNAENEQLEAGIAWNRAQTSRLEADYRLLHITGQLLDTFKLTLPSEGKPHRKPTNTKDPLLADSF